MGTRHEEGDKVRKPDGTVEEILSVENAESDSPDYVFSYGNRLKASDLEIVRRADEEIEDMVEVEVLNDVKQFMGIDMEIYGGFEAGDIVVIPADNAEILEDRGDIRILG